MSIEFYCPECQKLLRVADASAGKKCKCPSCGQIVVVPLQPEEFLEVKIETNCPKCRAVLLFAPELEGTRGACKACGHVFTISYQGSDEVETDSFAFQCPQCSFMFEGKPEMEGRKGKCPQCNAVFPIVRMAPREKLEPLAPPSKSTHQPTTRPSPRAEATRSPEIPKTLKPEALKPQSPKPEPQIPATRREADIDWASVSIPNSNWSASTSNQTWGSNPYSASLSNYEPAYSPPKASTNLSGLTIQFTILGVLFIVLACIGGLFSLYQFTMTWLAASKFGDMSPPMDRQAERLGFFVGMYGTIAIFLLFGLLQIIIGWAGINMIRKKGRAMAWFGTILMLIPGPSPCCILGIPFGIWAMILLLLDKKKRAVR